MMIFLFLVPWWAEVHIFIGFVVFYWILTPILYYTNVRSPLFISHPPNLIFFPVLGSRLLSHLRKRTFRPFWPSLQYLPCTPSKRHIQRNSLQPLFPALPLCYLCYDLSLGIRSEHICTCAYGVVSWKKFDGWDEED